MLYVPTKFGENASMMSKRTHVRVFNTRALRVDITSM
jgi:hypothetical protein